MNTSIDDYTYRHNIILYYMMVFQYVTILSFFSESVESSPEKCHSLILYRFHKSYFTYCNCRSNYIQWIEPSHVHRTNHRSQQKQKFLELALFASTRLFINRFFRNLIATTSFIINYCL